MAPSPEALRPPVLSLRPTGGACTSIVGRGRGTAAPNEESPVGSVEHAADHDQEMDCSLSMNGKSGEKNFPPPGRNGSNCPGTPLRASSGSPLRTRPVDVGSTTRPDRPNGIGDRIRPPVIMQVRSGRHRLSVAGSSHTETRSMSTPVGEMRVPPSADQPKSVTTPAQNRSARGVVGKESKDAWARLVSPRSRYTQRPSRRTGPANEGWRCAG